MKTKLTIHDRIELAIRCCLKCRDLPDFNTWAHMWLRNENRADKDAAMTAAMRATTYPGHYTALAAHYCTRVKDNDLSPCMVDLLVKNRTAEAILGAKRRGVTVTKIVREFFHRAK